MKQCDAPLQNENHTDEQFVALIANAQLPMISFLRTLLRYSGDVEDVLQETNLVLWRKRHEYDRTRSFLTWACAIAHMQVLAYLKKGSRDRLESMSEQLLQALAELASDRNSRMDVRLEALKECVQELPEGHRVLLRQRYRDGGGVSEIADETGRSANSLSTIFYRIRGALKECIERRMEARKA
ncbi:sigma-70 family RNA polymerase sigma factor [Calycomorphotria hydatis]|uniref:RNA polymerase sigma factor n=1 Tax=Calycomorphotria hydatis TaxID=2528027 RepID=A0A517T9U8_9PLAN|nr:sigma-70 family RNA polymerase sigma factor [Calycomorphotria hydatis]QDT65129.1 RNA polymerase sigma factor [Calycomorphotria hydatis]